MCGKPRPHRAWEGAARWEGRQSRGVLGPSHLRPTRWGLLRNGSPLLSSGAGAAGVFPQLGPLIKRKDLRFQPHSEQSGRPGHGTPTPRPWSSERSQFAEGSLGLPPQDAACRRQPPTAGRTPTPASGPQDRRHPPPGGSGHPAPASPFLFLRRGYCLDVPPALDRWTRRHQTRSHPSTTTALSRPRVRTRHPKSR